MSSLKKFAHRFEDALTAVITRDDVDESRHEVEAVIIDAKGNMIASWGYDDSRLIPLRSVAKLAQALPVVETGAASHFALSPAELAIMCASHRGHEYHVQALSGLFNKLHVDPEQMLVLPPTRPLDVNAADIRLKDGKAFTRLCHMCAGNHATFVCAALHAQEPVAGYNEASHPAQQRAREAIASMAGLNPQSMKTVPDGCGIPSYALSLREIAQMAASIADPSGLPEVRRHAVDTLYAAGQAHPELHSAHDAVEAAVFAAGAGQLYVKGGAEGVTLLADRSSGYGLALKCRDGELRGTFAVLGAFVGQICNLEPGHALWSKTQPAINNVLGRKVGGLRVDGL